MSSDDPSEPNAAEWLARNLDQPDLVVQGVPTSVASPTGSDAWQAPAALRRLLTRFSTFDGENAVDLESLRAADWGDWLASHLDVVEAHALIERAAEALPTRPVYAFVGGDNSITRTLLRNLPHAPLARFGLVTFDARHDARELPTDRPSNAGQTRQLIEDGLAPEHIVQIGIHGFANSLPHRAWCEEQGIRIATRRMIEEHGIRRVVDEALTYLEPEVDAIYVDCDLSVLDRAFAPACPGSRPGGLDPRQLAAALVRCGAHDKVVAADFVEVDPIRDVAQITMMGLAHALLSFAAGVAIRRARTGGEPT
ncbi:MAG TPA: arginase family protein [Nitriliruptorales bacterium]